MKHKAVLLQKIIDLLEISPGQIIVDATLGAGGHSVAILKKLKTKGVLVCFDLSHQALDNFSVILLKLRFAKKKKVFIKDELQIHLVQENFVNVASFIEKLKITQPDTIIADLGLSVDELETSGKGFSFHKNEFLDMRLDSSLKVTASDLLNGLYKKELEKLFRDVGECNFYKKLVKQILSFRAQKEITSTSELKSIILKALPVYQRIGVNKNPDAKVFQALRIAVNNEYGNLRDFLHNAFEIIAPKGKIAVISFHSGEDRIVKNFFCQKVICKEAEWISKLAKPFKQEIRENPNSRSAKLRIIRKNGTNKTQKT